MFFTSELQWEATSWRCNGLEGKTIIFGPCALCPGTTTRARPPRRRPGLEVVQTGAAPTQTEVGRADESPASGTGAAGGDVGGSVAAPKTLLAVCVAAEQANHELQNYAEFRPVFSAFDEVTTRRYAKITEQFMRGSVQLQQVFEDVVHGEMRVLGRPPRPGASQS